MTLNPESRGKFQSSIERLRLRVVHDDSELEKAIMDRLDAYPENDSNNFARDALQDGVGYSLSRFGDEPRRQTPLQLASPQEQNYARM